MRNILLIEDDLELQVLIKEYLERFEFRCSAYANPLDLLDELEKNIDKYSVVILDLTLPQMDGFDLFKKIKKIADIPIIISSARGDIGNKIYGFELGADDYLAKPYEPRELILRIDLILRRSNIYSNEVEKICEFEINRVTKQIFLNKKDCELTKIEYEIFTYLLTNADKSITRSEIINAVSLNTNTKDRTVDTHIRNIRLKIYDDSKHIKSMWGIGYKFVC